MTDRGYDHVAIEVGAAVALLGVYVLVGFEAFVLVTLLLVFQNQLRDSHE